MPEASAVRVVADYEPMYADPLRVEAGEPISVGSEDLEFPGWKWCRSRDGREGWVPIELIDESKEIATITESYSAVELAVRTGQEVVVHQSRHAWLLVTNAHGERGWIPASNVETVR